MLNQIKQAGDLWIGWKLGTCQGCERTIKVRIHGPDAGFCLVCREREEIAEVGKANCRRASFEPCARRIARMTAVYRKRHYAALPNPNWQDDDE
jgi:hypothetical protein